LVGEQTPTQVAAKGRGRHGPPAPQALAELDHLGFEEIVVHDSSRKRIEFGFSAFALR
jgi:hypothetical protein